MRDIIVIGAPVGGISALRHVVGALPMDLPASVFVVLHTSPESPILLTDVLNAPGRMRVTNAVDGKPIALSQIYVAHDGKHLVLEAGMVRLTPDPEDTKHRPAIDVLFQSAAAAYKSRVVAAILLHAKEDGLLGLHAVRQNGGRTVTHRNEKMPDKPRHPETGEDLAHEHLELEEIAPRLIAYVNGADGDGIGLPARPAR